MIGPLTNSSISKPLGSASEGRPLPAYRVEGGFGGVEYAYVLAGSAVERLENRPARPWDGGSGEGRGQREIARHTQTRSGSGGLHHDLVPYGKHVGLARAGHAQRLPDAGRGDQVELGLGDDQVGLWLTGERRHHLGLRGAGPGPFDPGAGQPCGQCRHALGRTDERHLVGFEVEAIRVSDDVIGDSVQDQDAHGDTSVEGPVGATERRRERIRAPRRAVRPVGRARWRRWRRRNPRLAGRPGSAER